jgi:hypothetical protein
MQEESFTLQGARMAFCEPPAATPTVENPTQNGNSLQRRKPTRSQIIAIVKSPIGNGVSKMIVGPLVFDPPFLAIPATYLD